MVKTVAQSAVAVKPIVIGDVTAFVWGIEDGRAGKSEFDGYDLFCGWKYTEWRQGWTLGRQAAIREAVQAAQVAQPAAPANWFTRPDSEYRKMDHEDRALFIERW